jgi:DNA polymerase V
MSAIEGETFAGDLKAFGGRIRDQVYRSTGIPVGVGIAGTKP